MFGSSWTVRVFGSLECSDAELVPHMARRGCRRGCGAFTFRGALEEMGEPLVEIGHSDLVPCDSSSACSYRVVSARKWQ